jgi:hypothetical protein
MPAIKGRNQQGGRAKLDHRLPSRNTSYQKRTHQLAAAQRRTAREADHRRVAERRRWSW